MDNAGTIELEKLDRRASGWRQSDEQSKLSIPGKVVMPMMPARMEKFYDLPRCGIAGDSTCGLSTITSHTGKRQVIQVVCPTSGAWIHMINRERIRGVFELTETVFAAIAGAFSYVPSLLG